MATEPVDPLVRRPGRPAGKGLRPREVRTCARHGDVYFGQYRAGPKSSREFVWRCTRCISEAVTRRHQKIKRTLVEEAGGGCAVCGYKRTVVNLHFHHVDPSRKSFAVNMARGKSLDAFRAEAAKCVLVCANCHGEIEAGLIASPPAGARFTEDYQMGTRASVARLRSAAC